MKKRLLSSILCVACVLSARVASADDLEAAVANDLSLTRVLNQLAGPTAARYLADGRLVIIQQSGEILVYTGTLPLIDAGTIPVNEAGERGLLGLAVDPQFAQTNRLYFYYSASGAQGSNRHRVAWATIDPVTSTVDVANRTVILQGLYGPANHNGGGIEFGADGYLYVGVGDTGCNCGCAPGTNTNNYYSTCLTNANGKILRIDRDGNIPASNPLVGLGQVTACGSVVSCFDQNGQEQEADPLVTGAPREEIYLWGFRNPWRFTFDSQTGYMWIGDVGEVTYEEITVSTQAGEHHGWPYREGVHGQGTGTCNTITPNAVGPCVEPVFEYSHNNNAASVTGGVFSNHCSWPAPYAGLYWFGDYNVGRIWTLTPSATRETITGGRTDTVRNVTGVVHFFEGNDGAVYYVSIDDGEIWRIAPAMPAICPPPPPDAGVPQDAALPPGDAMPGVDVPQPPVDTGVVVDDTGVVVDDTGVVVDDTGVVIDDSGFVGEERRGDDAGTPLDAGGAGADGSGGGPGNTDRSSDCSCNASPSSARSHSAFSMLLLIWWAVGRARRGRR